MEENRIHNIELALEAFRAINTFWFLKGPYPKNFSADFWDEEDFQDESSRRIIRADFEEHLEILKNVCFTYVQTLKIAIANIESEYNNIVLSSRNMEAAISLFKEKFEKAMFALEKECDANRLLLHFIVPLLKNGIITRSEGNIYQDYVSNIVMSYSHAVNVICSVFHLEQPWNRMTVDPDRTLVADKNTSGLQDDDKQGSKQKEESAPAAIQVTGIDDRDSTNNIENNPEKKIQRGNTHKKGRKSAFIHLADQTISGIVTDTTGCLQLGRDVSQFVISELNKDSRPEQVVALTIALEICELIPSLEEKKSAYYDILQRETGISFVLKTFSEKHKEFCDKDHNYKERAKLHTNIQNNDLNLIINYKNKLQEIKMKYKIEG